MRSSIKQVAVVAIVLNGEAPPTFVLQRRRTKSTWSLIKGTIEEDVGQAIRRECLEEAGVEVGDVLGTIGAYEYHKRFAEEPRQLFHVTVVLAQVVHIRYGYREERERERLFVGREEGVLALGRVAEQWLLWRALDQLTISKSFEA